MRIVTLTVNPALDLNTSVNELVPEHKLKCSNPKYDPGGGGINVARILQRLGGSPTAIFQCSGSAGEFILNYMTETGISCKAFPTNEWTRENFIVTELSNNDQYRFGLPGPTYSKEEEEIAFKQIQNLSPKPKFLVLSGSLAPGMKNNFYARICLWAKQEDVKVILDTSGQPLKKAIEAGCYLVKPNLRELAEIFDVKDLSIEESKKCAIDLIANNKAEIVVVSLGKDGALLATKNGVTYQKPPKVRIESAVGAGDSMVAGLTWALSMNYSENDILRFGVACGTAATMTPGTELCLPTDVFDLYKEL